MIKSIAYLHNQVNTMNCLLQTQYIDMKKTWINNRLKLLVCLLFVKQMGKYELIKFLATN